MPRCMLFGVLCRKNSSYTYVNLQKLPSLKVKPLVHGENNMIHQHHRMLYLLLVASLMGLLTGCAQRRSNSALTIRVSGDTDGIAYNGQCTAQKQGFWPGSSDAQGLDVTGMVNTAGQTKDFETRGFFIYCAVANQSAIGTIAIELLQEGNLVASAQSTSPDTPATLEFGQNP
jgi:hypothetical protein